LLTTLHITNFAILESAELPLGPGLTAITGETGAGKSILIDALALVLGGRASEKAIRAGHETAEIAVQFDGALPVASKVLLAELGIDEGDGTLILRRVIGKSVRRSYANGRLITTAQLRALAAPLCDLSSQHAQHRLLDPAHHLEVLDRFAHLGAARARHGDLHAAWRGLKQERDALETQQRAAADRLDYLRFVHKELAELDCKPGELAAVQTRLQRIKASESLAKTLGEAGELLGEDEGARGSAGRAARGLARIAGLDEKLPALQVRAEEIETLASELAFDIAHFARTLDRDDRQLASLAERQDALLRAIRKYGGSEEALLERAQSVAAELDTDTVDLRLAELAKALQKQSLLLRESAAALHEARSAARPGLEAAVTDVVRQLGMPAASFRIALESRTGSEPGPFGNDEATFYLRANKGENEGKLAEVASGGELSRVLLAVQRACSDAVFAEGSHEDAAASCIYDEADAGLSGSTGLVLGRFLREVGRRQQAICISHLPQVAAAADRHIRVTKSESGGRTRSVLSVLSEAERVTELARMLGTVDGEGDTALAHARRLLAEQRSPERAGS